MPTSTMHTVLLAGLAAMGHAYQSTYIAYDDPVNCPQTAHWVSALPYFTTEQTQPCSYAGTMTADASGDSNLFYWMYPAVDPDAPIAIFLNGGPGASSTFANFLINGPMRIASTGPGVDDYSVYLADASWVDAATMIFIDQPVGTGFSFGGRLMTTMEEAAEQFLYFLENLFNTYGFAGKDLYLTGESYGGKYLPAFSYAMLLANEQKGENFFNLQAMMVGDPYTAPLTQRTHMYIVPEAINVLDDSNMPQIATMIHRCQEIIANSFYSDTEKGDTCSNIMSYISDVSGQVFPYDKRIFTQDWDAVEDPTTNYFTISGQVQAIYEAIHVADSTKTPVFEMGSSAVATAFAGDQLLDYSW